MLLKTRQLCLREGCLALSRRRRRDRRAAPRLASATPLDLLLKGGLPKANNYADPAISTI
jgi:hypothetical protein